MCLNVLLGFSSPSLFSDLSPSSPESFLLSSTSKKHGVLRADPCQRQPDVLTLFDVGMWADKTTEIGVSEHVWRTRDPVVHNKEPE